MDTQIRPLDTTFLTRGSLRVRILKVDSPTLFWVQIDHARKDLEELIDDLTGRMTRRGASLRLWLHHAFVGTVVAVKEGKKWQRGIITKIEEGSQATVALRDWGRTIRRNLFDLYTLEERFCEKPWQAIPCGLGHVRPAGDRIRWSRRACELARLILEKRDGWMRIIQPIRDDAAIISLELKRETEDETRDVRQLFIQLGCAQAAKDPASPGLPGVGGF
ncbi:tudor and KH domain-containing protein-like [Monomorium pharaonis]|uniref:tudor and KH domain-containing protein-like n=1 Tax=Monomorium pharaonis TaxID=307658 RepID=UPI00102E19F7|nr:tudor and KH domain-containing protein-like [Monomorium pharaonis]